jgi:hypothetical protein
VSESPAIAPGDRVQVSRPIVDDLARGDWLLPGETIYALDVRGDRARVRCPSSGVDAWVDLDLLVYEEPPTCPVCDAPLTHVGATCPDARLSAHRAHEDH